MVKLSKTPICPHKRTITKIGYKYREVFCFDCGKKIDESSTINVKRKEYLLFKMALNNKLIGNMLVLIKKLAPFGIGPKKIEYMQFCQDDLDKRFKIK